jgi:hypothetical protein
MVQLQHADAFHLRRISVRTLPRHFEQRPRSEPGQGPSWFPDTSTAMAAQRDLRGTDDGAQGSAAIQASSVPLEGVGK